MGTPPWPVPSLVAGVEYGYIIGGAGAFTPDGGEPIELRAGDARYFAVNPQGVWDMRQAVRGLTDSGLNEPFTIVVAT